jgi:uncharacterized protein YndB with AHSA1/START domain
MENKFIARASMIIHVPVEKVWEALVDPEMIREYMFGTNVISEWKEGSQMIWKGEWQGKAYEDKGTILQLKPGRILQYSHFSPLSGIADKPENYHTVTIKLHEEETGTRVTLSQDNNPTELVRAHSEKNWEMMLEALKKYLEK